MKTLVRMQFGSHVYGTNTPNSDLDYKAVHVPDRDDILLQKVKASINTGRAKEFGERNNAGDIDFESFALQKFMGMLLEGQTVALNMLFTPKQWWLESSPEWEWIVDNRALWLHRKVAAFAGYCRQQANKYGIKGSRIAAVRTAVTVFQALENAHGPKAKLSDHWKTIQLALGRDIEPWPEDEHIEFLSEPSKTDPEKSIRMLSVCNRKVQEHITIKEAHRIYSHVLKEYGQRALQAESNENVDWKACMHAVRVAKEAEELLTTGHITYPRPEADLLLRIRRAEIPYKDVATLLEDGLERLEVIAKESKLPEKGNEKIAKQFTLEQYAEMVLSQ